MLPFNKTVIEVAPWITGLVKSIVNSAPAAIVNCCPGVEAPNTIGSVPSYLYAPKEGTPVGKLTVSAKETFKAFSKITFSLKVASTPDSKEEPVTLKVAKEPLFKAIVPAETAPVKVKVEFVVSRTVTF